MWRKLHGEGEKYSILVEKLEENKELLSPKRRWEIHDRESELDSANWIRVTEENDR